MPTLAEAHEIATAAEGKVEAPENDAKPAKAVKAPREPKTPVEPHACKCGVPKCDSTTTRNFAPGHDAKMVGYLTRQVVAGELTKTEALQKVTEVSGAGSLLVQKVSNGIQREIDKRKAKEAAAAAKPAEAAATEDVEAAQAAG